MFSFNSLRRNWARSVFVLLAVVLSTALLFTGCKTDEDDPPPGALHGTWHYINTYDENHNYDIVINTKTKTIEYTGSWGGKIKNSPNYDATEGVIIIEFTWYYETIYDSNYPYGIISEGETEAYNGKFGALYWNERTDASVKFADAYDAYWNHAMFDTLAEAQADFTWDKNTTYVSMGWDGIGTLTKQ